MLKWNTVDDLLKNSLLKLMAAEELSEMRLVGGTALSLHLGHRMSVDIEAIEKFLIGNIKTGLILLKTV